MSRDTMQGGAGPLPEDTVLDAVRNNTTAYEIAQRLGEGHGETPGRISCARPLPVLNRLRERGVLVRRVEGDPEAGPVVARWSFA